MHIQSPLRLCTAYETLSVCSTGFTSRAGWVSKSAPRRTCCQVAPVSASVRELRLYAPSVSTTWRAGPLCAKPGACLEAVCYRSPCSEFGTQQSRSPIAKIAFARPLRGHHAHTRTLVPFRARRLQQTPVRKPVRCLPRPSPQAPPRATDGTPPISCLHSRAWRCRATRQRCRLLHQAGGFGASPALPGLHSRRACDCRKEHASKPRTVHDLVHHRRYFQARASYSPRSLDDSCKQTCAVQVMST